MANPRRLLEENERLREERDHFKRLVEEWEARARPQPRGGEAENHRLLKPTWVTERMDERQAALNPEEEG